MAKASRDTRRSLRTMPVWGCEYCGESPSVRIRPARGKPFLVCATHQERGIAESGPGQIDEWPREWQN